MNTNKKLSTRALQLSTSLIAILAVSIAPVLAQPKEQKNPTGDSTAVSQSISFDGIEFGDDSSQWSNDNECDDPRFIGPATAVDMEDVDIARDATDCLTAYQVGDVTLKPQPQDIVGTIDFGDNSSEWANDGQCDDPRFGGEGTDDMLLDEDMNRDADDCRALFLSGAVEYLGDDINTQIIEFDNILFGDNLSEWKSDGECDDPRFRGTGMADQLVEADNGHDAVDCLALYKEGSITFISGATDTPPTPVGTIDFGDDTSQWANDNECDDPRFAGEGVAGILLDSDLGRDATDCRTLFEAGTIYLAAAGGEQADPGIDFGDDNNQYANDGECDDPRFAGEGVANILLEQDIKHDASDCRILYENGQIYLSDSNLDQTPIASTDFGDNSSEWALDGECDDPRFIGEGMASQLLVQDLGRDADDCSALVNSGNIALISAANVDFGDDAGQWPNDGECDDPRFAGDGVAGKLAAANFGHDATDCQQLLNTGDIQFVGGLLTVTNPGVEAISTPIPQNGDRIDFGDDSSVWSNDGECDDPRFEGPGVADSPADDDIKSDATDCSTLYESGQIQLSSPASLRGFHNSNFNFGDNTSQYANNDICDDPRFAGPGTDSILLAEDEGRDAADCRALFGVGQVSLASDMFINFGSDTSQWANDGECDDPRFAGKSMASDLNDQNIEQDATDCRAAFELGRIYLKDQGIIDFGDDSSEWANDNECDDPRFAGPGSAGEPTAENLLKDASDCRANFRNSQVYLLDGTQGSPAINFGDNTSSWASDGECDDPRFFGPGSADQLVYDDIGHDAQDCQALLIAGQIEFGAPLSTDGKVKGTQETQTGDINYGDDSSSWANDGECDDPRFEGPGAALTLLDEDLARDATDCRALMESGQLEYIGGESTAVPITSIISNGINFGDDSSDYANNNICDDLRFAGQGVDGILLPEDEGRDATDCLNNFLEGKVYLVTDSAATTETDFSQSNFNFGDDTSSWANDGQCDDPRFEGEGVSSILLDEDLGRDATDCTALLNEGKIRFVGEENSSTPTETISTDIDYGDDTSAWANNNMCDDPRFEGEGTAPPLLAEDERRDATDCEALLLAGKVQLIAQPTDTESTTNATEMSTPIDPNNVDFGDNASLFANDGECDDPRFAGEGMAQAPQFSGDANHDANDCQVLFDQGKISLASRNP